MHASSAPSTSLNSSRSGDAFCFAMPVNSMDMRVDQEFLVNPAALRDLLNLHVMPTFELHDERSA